jgi:hypothetical protein
MEKSARRMAAPAVRCGASACRRRRCDASRARVPVMTWGRLRRRPWAGGIMGNTRRYMVLPSRGAGIFRFLKVKPAPVTTN